MEYFNISGINARNWAWVIFSTGVGIPSMTNGGISCLVGSSIFIGGACCAKAFSNSDIITARKFLMTSSNGFAPKARKLKINNLQFSFHEKNNYYYYLFHGKNIFFREIVIFILVKDRVTGFRVSEVLPWRNGFKVCKLNNSFLHFLPNI